MSSEKLREAGELIKARKFPQARAILVEIDHPKAREWVGKIDAMQANIAVARPVPVAVQPRKRRLPKALALLILVILIAVGALAAVSISNQARANNALMGTAMKSFDLTANAPK